MTGSRWAAVVDALVAALEAADSMAGVQVLDGPPVGAPSSATEQVAVGWQFDDASDLAGTVAQSYRTTGGASAFRDEECEVDCAVRVVSGDTALAATRLRALALFTAVGDLLRASYTLSLDGVVEVEVSSARVRQAQSDAGAGCVVEFTVRVVAVI